MSGLAVSDRQFFVGGMVTAVNFQRPVCILAGFLTAVISTQPFNRIE
jgi:hypothetical protein